jgi:hypothetical protein
VADNTILLPASGGDTIRDIDRSQNSNPIAAKTQVVQLDAGGEGQESLVSAANPLPITDTYDRQIVSLLMQQLMFQQAAQIGGYVPLELGQIGA